MQGGIFDAGDANFVQDQLFTLKTKALVTKRTDDKAVSLFHQKAMSKTIVDHKPLPKVISPRGEGEQQLKAAAAKPQFIVKVS